MKKISTLVLIIAIISSLVGCSYINTLEYEQEPLMTDLEFSYKFMKEQEIKEYIDPTILENQKEWIDMFEVPTDIDALLKQKTLDELKNINLRLGFKTKYYIHENFKYYLDNLVQNGDILINTLKSNDYYYVTIKIPMKKTNKLDELRKTANYVGIPGVIGYDINHNEAVDEIYLKLLIEEINKKRELQNKDPIDTEIEQINYLDEYDSNLLFEDYDILTRTTEQDAEIASKSQLTLSNDQEDYLRNTGENNIFIQIEDKEALEQENIDNFNREVRRLIYDIQEFKDLTGTVISAEPIIPDINCIFKINDDNLINSLLSGYSLYDWGATINEVANNNTKDIELVFIYKHNLLTDDYDFISIYLNSIKSDLNIKNENLYVSNFLEESINKTLDSYNRAFSNRDLVSLTNGILIYPQDLGLYLLKYRDAINLGSSNIILDKILRRENNTYLCSVYQVTNESIKGTQGTSAKYLRHWYIRIKIQGASCSIDDMYLDFLTCIRIPQNELDKGSLHKLYSIENSKLKYVNDEQKNEIKQELVKLEESINNIKFLNEKQLFTTNMKDKLDENSDTGYKVVSINGINGYGIDSRFNTDNSVLPQRTRESYIQMIKNAVILYELSNFNKVYILPTNEWVSSEDDQIELCVNICFDYNNNALLWEKVYITYSKYKDRWVIDEMTVNSSQSFVGKDMRDAVIKHFEDYIEKK